MPTKRRTLIVLLTLLALFLLGTVAVLSTISFYLRIDPPAYITPAELEALSYNSTGRPERIPRIIHQTWKTETLPERWQAVSKSCTDLMPDYEYMLWTDTTSRKFIAEHYSWFLPTFDAYIYPIQRADAIRYFVLYHYGGVYLDLDVGCLRPLDDLLMFRVVLPKTIPVGVSNDLMFSEQGHPFMEQTIHNLVSFDHSYILNYPTVMFSTGPMFLSAQFGLYTASHPSSSELPGGDVRILPKSLYGKNAKPGEAPNSFFSHHYGSSWHADDAAFITFLGTWGKTLMWVGLLIFVIGVVRLIWQRRLKGQHGERDWRRFAFGGYDVVLPRAYHRDGGFHLDLGLVTVSEPSATTTELASSRSSLSSRTPSPSGDQQFLPIFRVNPFSAADVPYSDHHSIASRAVYAFRQAGTWVRTSIPGSSDFRLQHRTNRSRGVMLFLPDIFTSSARSAVEEQDIPLLESRLSNAQQPQVRSRSRSPMQNKGSEEIVVSLSSGQSNCSQHLMSDSPPIHPPPPPYDSGGAVRTPATSEWVAGEGVWDEWMGDEVAP
ncbi:glycosyltransferase family 32 protein [Ramaria rubella]|nr:glycosyltransferase family 32 protein [Ramaria rubella]